ncbi:DUF5953 family protein [Archangium sp.]|uniref:DUF5953 family protein n=1 Tax=Archangium sp. TaxID=1872627 RepID=UPI002D220DD7|nr:DUF5953 family protein [Archangium sp.]HYO60103.1 DUF5953 family protein [Archangium sp.]
MGHDERRLAVVHGMERALPGLHLGWTMSEAEGLIPLPQRDEWVARESADGDFPFLCNDDDNHVVTLGGWEIPAGRHPGGQPQLQVHAMLPREETTIAAAGDVLEAVAEGARALWGHLTPGSVLLVISEQVGPKVYGPPKPPRGLPALRFPNSLRAPEIPHCLGWLNYWSAATARALGFPDPERDAELLSRSRRTATGGWVVRLTEAPLELDNPAHLDTLKRSYERFPEIGGRSTP